MNDLVVKNVPFCGTGLLAIQEKESGKIYAGINPILRNLGFDDKQIEYRRDKWNADRVLNRGTRKFSGTLLNAGTGKDVWCIEVKKLPLALAKLEITPKMEKDMPELAAKLEEYQDKCADVLAEAFLPRKEKQEKPKKKNLSSANMLVKTVSGIFKDAGVDPLYIAAEAKRLYKEQADIDIMIPLVTDRETMPKLYDCTEIARELGILSNSGNPHNQAVSAIIKKLDVPDSEIVTTAFSRNGHDDITTQYKPSVFEDVKRWLEANGYPTKIPYVDSKGNQKTCTVVYAEVA